MAKGELLEANEAVKNDKNASTVQGAKYAASKLSLASSKVPHQPALTMISAPAQVTQPLFKKAIEKAKTATACAKKVKSNVPLLSRLPPPSTAAAYVAHLFSEGSEAPTNAEVATALASHIPEQTDRSLTTNYLYSVRKWASKLYMPVDPIAEKLV